MLPWTWRGKWPGQGSADCTWTPTRCRRSGRGRSRGWSGRAARSSRTAGSSGRRRRRPGSSVLPVRGAGGGGAGPVRRHRRGRAGDHRPAGRQGRRRNRAGRLRRRDRQCGLPRHRLPGRRTAHRRRAPAGTLAVRASRRRGRSTAGPDITGRAPSRPRPAGLLSSGGREPLPARPLLTHPAALQHEAFAGLQRQHLAAQPGSGSGVCCSPRSPSSPSPSAQAAPQQRC